MTTSVPLGDLAERITSGSRAWRSRLGSGTGRFLLAQCVRDGALDLSPAPAVNAPANREAERARVRDGDILITIVGEVGRVALVRDDPGEAYVSQSVALIRPRAGVDARYLETYLRSPLHGKTYFEEKQYGVGRGHLLLSHLRELPVLLLSAEDQAKVVANVDGLLPRVDVARAALAAALTRVRHFRRMIMREAVRRGEREAQLLPLSALAEIQGGIQKQPKRRPRDNHYPYLRVANVQRGKLDLTVIDRMELFGEELSRLRLLKGDLLIVEGNGSPSQIGRMAVWDGSIEDCVHQNHIIRARLGPSVLPEWVDLVWNSPSGQDAVRAVASSTSGLYTLSVGKVGRIELPVPSIPDQRALVSWVSRALSVADEIAGEVQRSTRRARVLERSVLGSAILRVLGDAS